MGDVSTVDLLRQIAFFQELSPAVLDQLASAALSRNYEKGRVLFSKGNPSKGFYCVISGRVRISLADHMGHEIIINIMRAGDVFGEIGVLDSMGRTADATVVLPSSMLVFPADVFRAHLRQEPQLALQLLAEMCRRFRLSIELIEDCLFLPGEARLAKQLLKLAGVNGRKQEADAAEVCLSQDELSNFLGISRQMVNYCLQKWSTAGRVKLHRGRIEIVRLADLRRVAEEPTNHRLMSSAL